MKKLLLFLTVLVFFGNTNAQETERRFSKNLETAKDVSPAPTIDNADAKMSITSEPTEVKDNRTLENRVRENNPVQKINKAPFRANCSTPISTFPWTENFNDGIFPPDCWNSTHIGPDNGEWSAKYADVYKGPTVYDGYFAFRADVYAQPGSGQSTDGQLSFLITPAISVPAIGSYVLEFMSYIGYAQYYQHSSIRVSTTVNNNTSAFTTLYTLNGADIAEAWQRIRVSLNAYAGQTIYLAFVYEGAQDHNWGIDNVSVKELPAIGVAVTAITTPVSGINLTAAETVTATIKNDGFDPITNLSDLKLKLTVDGIDIATETFNGNLASFGATANHTFAAKANLSANGDHTIAVTATLAGDDYAGNDSKTITVKNTVCNTITTFPWMENFNATDFPICWNRINSNGNWTRSAVSPYDSGYANRGRVEATNQYSYLITPAISLPAGGTCMLDFMSYIQYPQYYVGGTSDKNGRSRVFISTTVNDNIAAFSEIYFLQGTQVADSWQNISVNLASYVGQTVYIAFVYTGNYAHGWRVDNVRVAAQVQSNELQLITNAPYTQIPVSQILPPISVQARNSGSTTQTNVKLSAKLNGNPIGTSTSVASLVYNATANLTITPSVSVPLGDNTLLYEVSSTQGTSTQATFSIKGTEDTFAIDTVTNYNKGGVGGGDNSTISIGNVFTVTTTTNIKKVTIGFCALSGTEPLDYSISLYRVTGDLTFNTTALFTQTATRSVAGGFVTVSVPATQLTPGKYFLCVNQLTKETSIRLAYDANPVHTSYYIKSTGTLSVMPSNLNGVAVRMIIGNLYTKDVAIAAITAPVSQINLTATESVIATVKNEGSTPITTIDLKLTVDGNLIATETLTENIASGATKNYTFTQKANLSADGNHTITVQAILAGDENAANDSYTAKIKNTVCNAITSFPWTEGFEDESFWDCWRMIDADGDGRVWNVTTSANDPGYPQYDAHSGEYFMYSFSYNPITPDNYLITPQLVIPASGATLEYWIGEVASMYDEFNTYNENYSVLVSTTGTNVADFTPIHSETLTNTSWMQKEHSLNAYAGQSIYIAFRHHNNGVKVYALKLDDVSVISNAPIPVAIQTLKPADNDENVALDAEVSVTFNQPVTEGVLTGISINNGITASATVSGKKLTIIHSTFAYETEYTVTVPAGAIDGYDEVIEWTFTTIDKPVVEPITIVTLTPEDDSENIALNTEVSVIFSQNITPVNLTGISISNSSVTSTTVSGKKLTIAHNDFAYGTTYTISVPAGAIDGYDEVITWSFKTIVKTDLPVVNENEINIYQNNGNIFITLSENSDVRLLDVLGRVLGNYNVAANATLTINQLSGIYLIEVRSNNNVSTYKVVVK